MAEAFEFSIRASRQNVSENTVKVLRRGERLRRRTVEKLKAAVRALKLGR